MAFYALVKRWQTYRVREYYDMIAWYKKKLHQEWYESLSPADKEKVDKYREERRKQTRQLVSLAQLICEMGSAPFYRI